MDMLEGVQDYLSSAPSLLITTELNCKECDKQEKIVLEGIGNFFG
jgi:hypothetical protein